MIEYFIVSKIYVSNGWTGHHEGIAFATLFIVSTFKNRWYRRPITES